MVQLGVVPRYFDYKFTTLAYFGELIFVNWMKHLFVLSKVHKQGIARGRSLDLSKFNNYEELKAELDQLFEFEGELLAARSCWLVVYTDDEGDMMLVGDDPWQ